MKKPTVDPETFSRVLQVATELMRNRLVLSVDEFEVKLGEMFPGDAQRLATPLKGKKRSRWLNLIDWIKAAWTTEGNTEYVDLGGVRYLLWLPPCGHVNGEILTHYKDACLAIAALAGVADRELSRR